ncbi:MAG: hypothetical protein IH988_12005, partial [Planctomycetes bacterium]|nr:hypothetical protein [Planctomycetota bacterium]
MHVRWCCTTFLAIGLVGGGFALAGELTFAAYDIGNLGCDEVTVAYDINDFGVVVGLGGAGPCPPDGGHGLAWFNGVMTDLTATSDGAPFSAVWGISRDGTVVATGLGGEHVVFVRDGVGIEIDPPPGWEQNSYPRGINESGTMIVGSCWSPGNGMHAPAVYWTEDGSAVAIDLLPDMPEGSSAGAYDVNDSGVVVGYNSYGVDGSRGFIWAGGVVTELVNTLLEGGHLGAYAISNSGFVAGAADTPDGHRAIRYDMNTGEMIALGSGVAEDVNDRGDAVGYSFTGGVHAMLYKDGEAIDLDPFLPEYMDGTDAFAINRYGWIVGEAYVYNPDQYWGWLLVPLYDKGDYDGD